LGRRGARAHVRGVRRPGQRASQGRLTFHQWAARCQAHESQAVVMAAASRETRPGNDGVRAQRSATHCRYPVSALARRPPHGWGCARDRRPEDHNPHRSQRAMKITLSDTPLLSTQQIGELASTLDLLHKRTLAAIERLNKDIATRKQQIAARWKSAPGIGGADVARFAEHETVATVREIKDNSKAELDKILKDAGAPHAQLI